LLREVARVEGKAGGWKSPRESTQALPKNTQTKYSYKLGGKLNSHTHARGSTNGPIRRG